jgi:hypothetical protein
MMFFTDDLGRQIHHFTYDGIASHGLGCGTILFYLQSEEGSFGVILAIEDAKRLMDDLSRQIPIASGEDT